MAIRVDYSAWKVRNSKLGRMMDYTHPITRDHVASLEIICSIERGEARLSFEFTPFAVEDGADLGLSLAFTDERPKPVGLEVKSVAAGRSALMIPRTPQGKGLLISHLLAGEQLKFGIFQGPEQLVDMPFYNDAEFAILYEKAGGKPVYSIVQRGPSEEKKKKSWFGSWW